ncbi:MAG: tRNA preQ1(34) S-adenosylmethionine ribosyltransferase-isomerase QueA [Myxococcota bacterium]
MIHLNDLDYVLPPERIAQSPARPRDSARMLILDRSTGQLEDALFSDLPERVDARDLLLVNDTRVVPARLRGHKATGGRAEALLLQRPAPGRWLALVRTTGRLRPGIKLQLGEIEAEIEEVLEEGRCHLRMRPEDADSILERVGEAPLPPYIRRPHSRKEDLEDYQTVFAREPGAVAAPTASLHFTPELASRLRPTPVTLHVGPGTFRPLHQAHLEAHSLEPERFAVSDDAATRIARTRSVGGRVIAVGTTVVRALESCGGEAAHGKTDLLILPGYRFRVVDSLITNFHLPRSSLLALVMSFGGIEPIRRAYAHAIERGYRFYSYGDAMWIR